MKNYRIVDENMPWDFQIRWNVVKTEMNLLSKTIGLKRMFDKSIRHVCYPMDIIVFSSIYNNR